MRIASTVGAHTGRAHSAIAGMVRDPVSRTVLKVRDVESKTETANIDRPIWKSSVLCVLNEDPTAKHKVDPTCLFWREAKARNQSARAVAAPTSRL